MALSVHTDKSVLGVDWSNIDTVLLDMDGTLLDLRFDTEFWTEIVPASQLVLSRLLVKHR